MAVKKKAKKTSDNGKTSGKNRVAAVEKEVRIAPLNVGRFPLKLCGTSQLVQHCFSEKVYGEILKGQLPGQPTKRKDRIPRCPEEEFVGSLHWVAGEKPTFSYDEDNKRWKFDEKQLKQCIVKATFGIPLTAFKNSIISACRSTGYAMTEMRQMVFVGSDDDPEYAVIQSPHPPQMVEHAVRLQNKTAMIRFRGCFPEWKVRIVVTHNRDVITEEQVVNLFQLAGFSVGVGEGRPEKSALGWGRYCVEGS